MNPIYPLVTISAFFWGANFVLAGPVLSDLPPMWAAALRFLLGAALMLSIAKIQGEGLWRLARNHAGAYLFLGLVGIAGFNLFFFRAMQSTSPDNGALIMATNPLLTTLLAALFLGERANARHWWALPVTLAGVAVVILHGKSLSHVAKGDFLMLGANFTWALFNVCSRRFMPKGSAVGNTAMMMTAGAFILLMAALASGTHFALPGMKAGLALAVMAGGGTVLAYLFWGMGIRQLGAGKTSLFLNLVPVFAMLIGGATGNPPTSAQIGGGLLVLIGVTMAMMPARN